MLLLLFRHPFRRHEMVVHNLEIVQGCCPCELLQSDLSAHFPRKWIYTACCFPERRITHQHSFMTKNQHSMRPFEEGMSRGKERSVKMIREVFQMMEMLRCSKANIQIVQFSELIRIGNEILWPFQNRTTQIRHGRILFGQDAEWMATDLRNTFSPSATPLFPGFLGPFHPTGNRNGQKWRQTDLWNVHPPLLNLPFLSFWRISSRKRTCVWLQRNCITRVQVLDKVVPARSNFLRPCAARGRGQNWCEAISQCVPPQ